MTLPPLPQVISEKLPEARRLFSRPEVRAFAGLSPVKLKPKTSRERVSMAKPEATAGMPQGSYGFFLPLSSVDIPAKNRKLSDKLEAHPIQLSSGITKNLNYQSNLFVVSPDKQDYVASPKELTCRAPKECFVFTTPGDFNPILGDLVTKFIESEEEKLAARLEALFPDASYKPLGEDEPVLFFPRKVEDVRKVSGLCMIGRVYPAIFKGRNIAGRGASKSIIAVDVDGKSVEFTVREEAFISSFKKAELDQAIEMIKSHEESLIKDLSSLLGGLDQNMRESSEVVELPATTSLSLVPTESHEDLTSFVEDLPTAEDFIADVAPDQLSEASDSDDFVVPDLESTSEELPPPLEDQEDPMPLTDDFEDVIPPHEEDPHPDLVDIPDEASSDLVEDIEPTPDCMPPDPTTDLVPLTALPSLFQSLMSQVLSEFKAREVAKEALLEENFRLKLENAKLTFKNEILSARDASVSVSLGVS